MLVTRTYLQLASPDALRALESRDADVRFVHRSPCSVARYRELYRDVGAAWHWHDRDGWSDQQLAAQLAKPGVAVWELLVGDETAGYFELERHDDGGVEIVYFGLVERFFGRGLGAAMLTRAAREGWAMGATRVWLHTCTLDSPRALPNYLARGFVPYKTETYEA